MRWIVSRSIVSGKKSTTTCFSNWSAGRSASCYTKDEVVSSYGKRKTEEIRLILVSLCFCNSYNDDDASGKVTWVDYVCNFFFWMMMHADARGSGILFPHSFFSTGIASFFLFDRAVLLGNKKIELSLFQKHMNVECAAYYIFLAVGLSGTHMLQSARVLHSSIKFSKRGMK